MRVRIFLIALLLLIPSFAPAQGRGSLTVDVRSAGTLTSVPPGAQRVSMLTLVLTASCAADVTLSSLELTHHGMGALTDIAGVYAESDGRRVSRSRPFSSRDGVLTLDLSGVTVPACSSKNLTVRANYSGDAALSGEHQLVIQGSSSFRTAAGVTVHNTSAAVHRTVGEQSGTVTVEVLPPVNAVRYGDRRIVARLRISVDQSHDQRLYSIVLTNDGSAKDSNLQKIAAYLRGQPVTREWSRMDGKTVTLLFDPPLPLERGKTWLLDVRADVRSGISKTVGFTVEEEGDVLAVPVTGRR